MESIIRDAPSVNDFLDDDVTDSNSGQMTTLTLTTPATVSNDTPTARPEPSENFQTTLSDTFFASDKVSIPTSSTRNEPHNVRLANKQNTLKRQRLSQDEIDDIFG